MEDKYKVSTPAGRTYSRHNTMSEGLKHVAHVLESRGFPPTVKEAMEHGFSLTRGSHDPAYHDSQKNKGGKK